MVFFKGHSNENYFILILDIRAKLSLNIDYVSLICSQSYGLGGDGIIRILKLSHELNSKIISYFSDRISSCNWYMDYRNSNGTIAQICGNGIRVLSHYLYVCKLELNNEFMVGSKIGYHLIIVNKINNSIADITIEVGKVNNLGISSIVIDGYTVNGVVVCTGNPHLACVGFSFNELNSLNLNKPIYLNKFTFPEGTNIELLTKSIRKVASMRVCERGVGETRSCGTGAIAATFATFITQGIDKGILKVKLPGGELITGITDKTSYLRGPSVLLM